MCSPMIAVDLMCEARKRNEGITSIPLETWRFMFHLYDRFRLLYNKLEIYVMYTQMKSLASLKLRFP